MMKTMKYRKGASTFSTIVLGILLALLLLVQMPTTARADENHLGIEITIDDRDSGDISIVGVEVLIDTTEARDISVAAADVEMRGEASGDVSIAAAQIDIDANIGGELSAAAAELTYAGTVQGEVSLAAAELHFNGTAGNGAEFLGADVYLDGTINGDLIVYADQFHASPGSVITGNFEFKGEEEPILPEGLIVGGEYTYTYVDFDEWEGDMSVMIVPVVALAGVGLALTLLVFLPFAVIIGAGILLLLMTGLTGRTVDGIRQRPLASMGMGIVVLIGLMAIAALLCITIIGIPLALAIITFYPILLLLGFIVAVLGIPYMVLRKNPADVGGFAKVGLFFVSLVLLAILFAIPAIGQLLFAAAVLMGVGAFGAAVLGGRNRETTAAA